MSEHTLRLLTTLLLLACVHLFGVSHALRIQGRYLIEDPSAPPVVLRGVSHSGGEFMCVSNSGIFDGPVTNASIQAMKSWHINVVRIPMNEDCWLGINGVSPLYSGAPYQAAMIDYVDRLHAFGIYSILDLHWTAPGTILAKGQQPMPNTNHTPAFWLSVATAMKSRSAYVIFDVFNEPYPDRAPGAACDDAAWTCWRDGGTCIGIDFDVAGMQLLVDTIRIDAGAENMLMIGGLTWANNLTQWLQYRPTDPLNQTAASVHLYNFNACVDASCWNATLLPILTSDIPVIIGEFGENDCLGWFVDSLAAWFTVNGVSHSAWTWNTWNCDSGPALIVNATTGNCTTAYGCTVKALYVKEAQLG